jgi:hypothetical protein
MVEFSSMSRPLEPWEVCVVRPLVLLLVAGLVSWTGAAAADDDFEIPLAPLAPPSAVEETEDEPALEEVPPAAEAPPPPVEPRRDAEPSPRAVFAWGGAYLPLSAEVPGGLAGGLSLEQRLPVDGLSLRADLSGSFHRLAGPQVVAGRGLDAGFVEVSRLVGLAAGLSWQPSASASGQGPYVAATAGAVLDHAERRVFSEASGGITLRPTATLAAGMGLAVGPGRLRMELALRGLHLPMGPDSAIVARARAGVDLRVGYRLGL